MKTHAGLLLLVPLILTSAFGCATARMPVDETLASGEYLAVKGRNGWKIKEHVTFGAFAAERIERSWTKGRGLVLNELELDRRRQTYSFTLSEGGSALFVVTCETALGRGAVATPVVDVEFKNDSRLHCTIARMDGSDVWTLALEERGERPLKGTLGSGSGAFDVEGTSKLRKGLPAAFTTGYYLRRDGRRTAAVEVVNAGGVWLDVGLSASDRHVMAAAAGALLLLEDLRGTLEAA